MLCKMFFLLFVITFHVDVAKALRIDVLVNQGEANCTKNLICGQDLSSNVSVTWYVLEMKDLFLRARAVKNLTGDMIVEAGPRVCVPTFLEHGVLQTNNVCFNECELLLKDECPLFVRHVHNNSSWYQSIYHADQSSTYAHDAFLSILSMIIQQEVVSAVIIVLQDSYQTLRFLYFLPASLSHVLLVVNEAGNFSRPGLLMDLHKNIREENLNFIVICNSKCIRNIVQKVYDLEVEISRTRISKLSRWLFIPVEGAIENNLLKDLPYSQAADMFIVHFQHCQQMYHRLNYENMADNLTASTHTNTSIQDTHRQEEYFNSERGPVADVYSMYNTNQGQRLRLKARVASDNRQTKTVIFDSERYGYNNNTFVVGMLEWPPFVYRVNKSGVISYEGLSVDLLEELARRLNFSFVYEESADGEWGRVLNGSWTGLVGEIGQGKFDLIATPLTISDARETMMDFTQPYFYVHSMVILSKPDPNTGKWLTLINPFRWEVHVSVILSLFVSTLLLFVVEEINPINKWKENRVADRRRRYGDILWYHFGALMANGGAYLPMTQSGRSVIACWWLLTVIVAATYSGNLIAFLTVNKENPPFTTLSEMIFQQEFKWGLLGGSAIITLFQESKRSDYTQIWNGVEKATVVDQDVQSLDLEVHLNKVKTEKYAYIGDSTTWELWQTDSCNLMVLGERFYPMTYGIGLPNNSVNTKVFSNQLLRIQESGLIRVWHQKWKSRVRCEGPTRSAKRVDLMGLQSAFYAAGIGVFFALLVLLNEVIYNKTCKQSCRPTSCRLCGNGACMSCVQKVKERCACFRAKYE